MPAQSMENYDTAAASTSASQVRNWVQNGSPSYAQGNTYQTNGQNGNFTIIC
jgi:hypothetical protein